MRNGKSFILGLGIIILSIVFLLFPGGIFGYSMVDRFLVYLLTFLGIFAGLIIYYGAFITNKKILFLGLIIGFCAWVSLLVWLVMTLQGSQLLIFVVSGGSVLLSIFGAPPLYIIWFYLLLAPIFEVTLKNAPILLGFTIINIIMACLSFIIAIRGEAFKRKREEKKVKSKEEYQKLKENAVNYIKKISSIYDNVSFSFISSKTELKKDEIHRLIEDLLHNEEISGRIKGNSIIFKEEEKIKKSKFPINCPQCHYFFSKFHVPTQVLEGKFDYRQPVYCPKCKEEFTLFISKNPDTGRLDIQYT